MKRGYQDELECWQAWPTARFLKISIRVTVTNSAPLAEIQKECAKTQKLMLKLPMKPKELIMKWCWRTSHIVVFSLYEPSSPHRELNLPKQEKGSYQHAHIVQAGSRKTQYKMSTRGLGPYSCQHLLDTCWHHSKWSFTHYSKHRGYAVVFAKILKCTWILRLPQTVTPVRKWRNKRVKRELNHNVEKISKCPKWEGKWTKRQEFKLLSYTLMII